MARFALTRSASLVGILLGLSVVVSADPVRAMVGASATPQIVEAKRYELGLDRPVRTDIAAFLPATVELAVAALALAVILGGAQTRLLPGGPPVP